MAFVGPSLGMGVRAFVGPCVLGPSWGPAFLGLLRALFWYTGVFFARLGASTDLADPFAAVSLGHEFLLILTSLTSPKEGGHEVPWGEVGVGVRFSQRKQKLPNILLMWPV